MARKPAKEARCAHPYPQVDRAWAGADNLLTDAQREACEAYIKSQMHEGWRLIASLPTIQHIPGATYKRPALQRLLKDIQSGHVDVVVVYKIDRLTRSLLADFAKLVEIFDTKLVSFVAVTQQVPSTPRPPWADSTLVFLSFAQFERELSSERVRDKILRGLTEEGQMDRRKCAARLRQQGKEARRHAKPRQCA